MFYCPIVNCVMSVADKYGMSLNIESNTFSRAVVKPCLIPPKQKTNVISLFRFNFMLKLMLRNLESSFLI